MQNQVFHTFQIKRTGGNRWSYRIDGVEKQFLIWDQDGTHVAAGLESYASGSTVALHAYKELRYEEDESGWLNWWTGQDSETVGPSMCGSWVSSNHWSAGLNVC